MDFNIYNKSLSSYGLICFYNFKENGKNNYKIILVKRKDTIGYVEFLRGKYQDDNDEYIMKLINMMTVEEKQRILDIYDFDNLRNILRMTKKKFLYKQEYESAKIKFNNLIAKNKLKELIGKSNTKWTETEWGLPKGRKNSKETDLQCGVREFLEETNITKKNINVLINVKPFEEKYTSINNITYKHIYYFAEYNNSENDLLMNPLNKNQVNEISDLQWFNGKECSEKIRDYYIEKKKILEKSFSFIDDIDKEFIIS
jgi:ADP-ribose pyrophosphatase YjhB (NUDIX family)